ncbi:glycosyltransferase family 9 protein [Streptomyces sp. B93]|nr:glycosyltransferase family 9 protein [Streptomyces sp. B93]
MKALVVRPDGFTGVLLSGPAVRALATRASRVTMLCASPGAPAARLLPHVDDVLVWDGPWDPGAGAPGSEADTGRMIRRLRQEAYDIALVLAPRGQSPLPAARLLRTADVRRIGADCPAPGGASGEGDPEGPLDLSYRRPPDRHEAAAALDAAAAMGFRLRTGDDGRLRVLPAPDTASLTGNGPYVVVHPGGTGRRAPARCAQAAELLADAGHRVVVTGDATEAPLTRGVSGGTAVDLGGRTTPRQLAGVLRAADAVVAGDPAAAQLAAAVATPVVALPGPGTPYRVPAIALGDGDGSGFAPLDVVRAVRELLAPGR